MEDTFSNCPYCGSVAYEYSFTWGTLIAESTQALTEFGLKKMVVLPILREVIIATPASFIRQVLQGMPATPGLICKRCRNYVVVCPSCRTYTIEHEFPSAGKIHRCLHCKTGFCICEESDEFSRLLGKKNSVQWMSAIIGAAILIGVIALLIRLIYIIAERF